MTDGRTDSDFVALRAGQSIGRYLIVSLLGQGGFGITYRATDSQLGREVAIKEYLPAALAVRHDGSTVLPRSQGAAEDFAWGRDRFVAEGRTLAALHHAPGIVRVHDFLEANGTAYLVMELLGGETLQERIRNHGPLDAAAVDRIVKPLLDGLEQVHAAGFLHRDIKPANILLDKEGRPTLIDFGASRAAVAGRSQAMTAVFTPAYAPVEQFSAATQGPWTDIYALAATLYHGITGQAPPNSIDRMLDDAYVPLAGNRPGFPPRLLAGIDAGLRVRASDRPQSIAAWRTLLSGAESADSSGQATVLMRPKSAAAVAARDPAVAGRPRWKGMMLAGGAAVALLALGGVYLALSPPVAPIVPVAAAPSTQDMAAQRASSKEAEELQRLRGDAETRRKADEETALRRRIEDEFRQKSDAEAAARAKVELEAKQLAEAEAATRRKAEEDDRKTAELAESALHLGQADWQRLQVALTSLGFPTAGTDGVFGPRSREMMAAWQRKNGRAATSYVTADQQSALLREAAPGLARYDEEQKKLEAEKRKQAETERAAAAVMARPVAPPVTPPAATPAPAAKGANQCDGTWRSQWCRGAYEGFAGDCWTATMTIRNGIVSDGWAHRADPSQRNVVSGSIDSGGSVLLTFDGIGSQTNVNRRFIAKMSGAVANGVLTANGRGGANGREFSVRVQCR